MRDNHVLAGFYPRLQIENALAPAFGAPSFWVGHAGFREGPVCPRVILTKWGFLENETHHCLNGPRVFAGGPVRGRHTSRGTGIFLADGRL